VTQIAGRSSSSTAQTAPIGPERPPELPPPGHPQMHGAARDPGTEDQVPGFAAGGLPEPPPPSYADYLRSVVHPATAQDGAGSSRSHGSVEFYGHDDISKASIMRAQVASKYEHAMNTWKMRGAPVYKAKTGAMLHEAVRKWQVRSTRATKKRAV